MSSPDWRVRMQRVQKRAGRGVWSFCGYLGGGARERGLERRTRGSFLELEEKRGVWKLERERERELFGVVDRVTGLSRVGETRVPAPSDASHQRDVHVQAQAPCPTPEGHSRDTRGAVAKRMTREREVATPFFCFFYWVFV